MASQTQGIQQLLAAEKRAADKVGEARKRKYFGVGQLNDFFFAICHGSQEAFSARGGEEKIDTRRF